MGARRAVLSFVAGLVMTVALVVLVPVVVDKYVEGLIADLVGDTEVWLLTAEAIVQVLIWLVVIALMLVLGAGGILRRFGVFGLIGLVFAYWLLGDVTDAVIPLLITAAMMAVSWSRDRRRKAKGSGTDKSRFGCAVPADGPRRTGSLLS